MEKLIKDLKKGDKLKLLGQEYVIETVEISNIGKQGKRKCRIEVKSPAGEKTVVIRPEDYPMETL